MAKQLSAKSPGKKASPTPSKSGRTAKPKSAAKRKPSKSSLQVTIRMYCQGLGDCFLLTFSNGSKTKPTRVLIDCGVFLNTPGERARMRAVAEDIRKETGGQIDLLIVTHEHWDHIAGFSHANDIFEKSINFEEVWLSWAENLDDADSRSIKSELGKKRDQLKAALGLAGKQIKSAGFAAAQGLQDDLVSAHGLLEFLGPGEVAQGFGVAAAKAADAARMDLGTTMKWLRAKVRAKDYCAPGQIRDVPGDLGIKAYVLGPPRGASQLRKMDPTGNQGYELMATRVSLLGAVDAFALGEHPSDKPLPGPFEERYRVGLEEAREDSFFRERYGFPGDPLSDPGGEWRRIDLDWLVGGLSRLALQLDTGVNNTSLALAFELPGGRTLIFPGDAQIGNWLSWGALKFKIKDQSGRDLEVTSKDLLNRAVFYKVGHHGSHNATLRVGGLEEMTSGDLVAMIPTDQVYAKTKRPPKTGWEMPAHGVHEALSGFTNGRIVRADHTSSKQLTDEAKSSVHDSRSWQEFIERVTFGGEFPADAKKKKGEPLYIEYSIQF
jgi:Metallo-beta-lactamase superfamily